MNYTVEMTAVGRQDADAAYLWLSQRTIHAGKWLDGLEKAIADLDHLSDRLAAGTREAVNLTNRFVNCSMESPPHIYRVLFIVRSNKVYVLHVGHGARDAMRPEDVIFPQNDS